MYGEAKIFIGEIVEVEGNRVKIKHNNIKTDFYPYLQSSNAFKKSFSPPKVGEKVVLFKSNAMGFVIGGFLDSTDEIIGDGEVVEFSDGLKISYKDKKLDIEGAGDITINCQNAKINASGEIILGGDDAFGVVTGACICPFTGAPHADISMKVKASK